MAVLTETQRADENAKIMEEWSLRHQSTSLLKSELRAIVDAADNWIDANGLGFIQQLRLAVPGKEAEVTKLVAAEILSFVIQRRFLEDA